MILSQKDPRWANIKLGTSHYYIWAKGCLITELAEILNTTPDVVNQRLNDLPVDAKGNTGFALDSTGQRCLVVWARIQEAFPEVTVRRVWEYNNEAVLSALTQHGESVIVEVDATPIGGTGRHWVRYIGEHKLHNPWDMPGSEQPTSTFPNPTGFAVISKVAGQVVDQPAAPTAQPAVENTYKGLDLNNPESVKAAIDTWHDVANGLYVKADEYVQFKSRVCEALGIGIGSSIDDLVANITTLKEDFKKQVLVATGVPEAAQIEGQGPVSQPKPALEVTMKNLPAHEKETLMNHFLGFEAGVKELFGIK